MQIGAVAVADEALLAIPPPRAALFVEIVATDADDTEASSPFLPIGDGMTTVERLEDDVSPEALPLCPGTFPEVVGAEAATPTEIMISSSLPAKGARTSAAGPGSEGTTETLHCSAATIIPEILNADLGAEIKSASCPLAKRGPIEENAQKDDEVVEMLPRSTDASTRVIQAEAETAKQFPPSLQMQTMLQIAETLEDGASPKTLPSWATTFPEVVTELGVDRLPVVSQSGQEVTATAPLPATGNGVDRRGEASTTPKPMAAKPKMQAETNVTGLSTVAMEDSGDSTTGVRSATAVGQGRAGNGDGTEAQGPSIAGKGELAASMPLRTTEEPSDTADDSVRDEGKQGTENDKLHLERLVAKFNSWVRSVNFPVRKVEAGLVADGMRVGAVATEALEEGRPYLSVPDSVILDASKVRTGKNGIEYWLLESCLLICTRILTSKTCEK